MFDQTLRFYARGDASVPCPHGADATPQRRTIVGKSHVEVKPGQWAWVPNDIGKPYVGLFHHDLVKACKEGDLWAADDDTARICGVTFDPTFGGVVKVASAPTPTKPAPFALSPSVNPAPPIPVADESASGR